MTFPVCPVRWLPIVLQRAMTDRVRDHSPAQYSFYSDFPPTTLGLTIYLDVLTSNVAPNTPHRSIAFNGTVRVVEPPSQTGFDAGLWFLYAILLTSMAFAGWSSWAVVKGKWLGRGSGAEEKLGRKERMRKVKVVVPATSGKPYPESAKPYEVSLTHGRLVEILVFSSPSLGRER